MKIFTKMKNIVYISLILGNVIVRYKRNVNNNIRFDNLEKFKNFIKGVNDAISQS